jgi:RimJ/RimL family protein N-acetyltransferase
MAARAAVVEGACFNSAAPDLAFNRARIAGKLHRWREACSYYAASLQSHGAHGATYYNLGMAHWQLAEHAQAQGCLGRAVELDPDSELYRAQRDAVARWRERCRATLPGARETLTAPPPRDLCASLLGPHHAEALCRHHRAPDVPRLAGLPPLRSVAAARRWIASQEAVLGKITLAVVEAEHGLVGSVALRQAGSAALFYYWIGRDFQRRGYGAFALRLLCDFAGSRGVTHLFSAVYRKNARSRRALEANGFRPLASSVRPVATDAVLYQRALRSAAGVPAADHEALQALAESIRAHERAADLPSPWTLGA